jgi:membrane protein
MLKKILVIKDFLLKDIWHIHLKDLSPKKALQIKALQVLILSIRGIYEDKIQQRAAALTLYTLLSIVPILAIGFGVAKGFGYDQYLKGQLISYLDTKEAQKVTKPDDPEKVDYSDAYRQVIEQLINFADSMLAKTKGGLVAVVALGLLFWTVMQVLSNIESSFNDIWQIKKSRPFVRKLTDYLSMMFITPVLLIGITIAIVTLKALKVHSLISPFLFLTVKLAPVVLIIILFSLIFIIMPNTKVKIISGLVGGVIAGIIFYLTQQVYVYFQIGVSTNNAIYGGFAALPLFIIWLQLSWTILLFGAKVAFATQNIEMYAYETESVHMSDYSRRVLALLITHRITQNFKEGLKPLSPNQLSKELKIPIRMTKSLLQDLVRCNILAEVYTDKPKLTAYQPSQDIERYSIKFIMETLDKEGEEYIALKDSELTQKIVTFHEKFYKQIEKMPENAQLKDL